MQKRFIEKKNKKGFLLAEETLKIILAVIGIGFLVFLLSSIYFSNVQDKNVKHAKNVLRDSEESIENTLELVEQGKGSLNNGSSEVIDVNSPQGWSLFSYIPSKEKNVPNSCASQNCVCVCDSLWIKEDFLRGERQPEECSENGECLIVSDLNKFQEIKIQEGVNKINITKNKSGIHIQEID